MSWFMTSTVVSIWDLESQKIATHARCMNTTVSGQPVEKRQFETNCLENDSLLPSEDTAVGLSLIRQCTDLLTDGALAFSTIMLSLTIDCMDIMAIWKRQEVRLQKKNAG